MKKEAEQKKQQAERIDRRAVCNKKEKKRRVKTSFNFITIKTTTTNSFSLRSFRN